MPLYHQRDGAIVCMLRASLMLRSKDHTRSFLLRITDSWLGFKSDIVHHTVEA